MRSIRMRSSYAIATVLVMLFALGCEEKNASQGRPLEPIVVKTSIVLTDPTGTMVPTPDPQSITIAHIATWCPYSKIFLNVIQDLVSTQHLDPSKVLIVVADERKSIMKQAATALKENEIDRSTFDDLVAKYRLDQADEELVLFDESVLQDLPVTYLIASLKPDQESKSVPALLVLSSGQWQDSEQLYEMLMLRNNIPANVIAESMARHMPNP